MARPVRSPFAVTLGVWKALFLREAVTRLKRNRMSWFGLLVEPVAHIALLMWLFYIGFRQRVIAGGDVQVFIMLGILGFFLPRNMLTLGGMAASKSEALYTFRNVKPIDTVIARIALESLISVVVFLAACVVAYYLGFAIVPADPLAAILALGALWLIGLGLALVFSVAASVGDLNAVPRMIVAPLYLFSAIIYPSVAVPPSMRQTLLYNPVLHGIESLRVAFMPGYRVPPGIDLGYLVQVAVVLIFFGLALHVRFEEKLSAQ
jgi:capsular polysaccharide transport system permease protein